MNIEKENMSRFQHIPHLFAITIFSSLVAGQFAQS